MPGRYRLEILQHRQVAPGHWEIVLPAVDGLVHSAPGQFVSLLCRSSESCDPLLRRPFSIYRVGEESISLLYRVVGRGSRALSRFREGETLDCVGPLGRGFSYGDLPSGASVALVGGGIGTPPLFFLSQALLTRGIFPEVYAGFATAEQVVVVEEWRRLGLLPQVSTDDGSIGERGFVTQLLERRLACGGLDRIFACGPYPMLRTVAHLAQRYGVPCQVAMEEWMACGLGVCLSCVVKVVSGDDAGGKWVRVCREGPVLDASKVVWSGA